MPDIPLLRKPDGTLAEAQADADGKLIVASEVTLPEGMATEATADRAADAAEELAGTVATAVPLAGDAGVGTYVIAGNITTTPAPGQTATATPIGDEAGLLVRHVGDVSLGAAVEPAGEVNALATKAYQGDEWVVTAQAPATAPLHTIGVGPGDTPERLATHGEQVTQTGHLSSIDATTAATAAEVADDATTADVQAVRDRLPSALEAGRLTVETELGATGPLATEAKQDTGNASLSSIDSKLPAQGPALYTAAQPVVLARPSRNADGASLVAAGTSHVISATLASLRRLEWRYTGSGTKYLVICNQAGGTATAANWVKWYRPMTNGAGVAYFEWPEGLFCNLGIVLGVSATEPTTTLTLSANATENFIPVNWAFQ